MLTDQLQNPVYRCLQIMTDNMLVSQYRLYSSDSQNHYTPESFFEEYMCGVFSMQRQAGHSNAIRSWILQNCGNMKAAVFLRNMSAAAHFESELKDRFFSHHIAHRTLVKSIHSSPDNLRGMDSDIVFVDGAKTMAPSKLRALRGNLSALYRWKITKKKPFLYLEVA